MAEPLYHEQIGTNMAKQLLGNDFVSGNNMSYYIVSEYNGTVIIQHDNESGNDYEVKLEESRVDNAQEVPRIESFRGEYHTRTSKALVAEVAIIIASAMVVAILAAFSAYAMWF